jgi:hypothetical protein
MLAARTYEFRGRPSVPVTIAWGTRDRILHPRQAAAERDSQRQSDDRTADAARLLAPDTRRVAVGRALAQ